MPDQTIYPLFVYGSLLSGFKSQAYEYISRFFNLVGKAKVKGKLYDMGDYPAAIRSVLSAIATQGKALTARAAADIQAWIDCYETDAEFGMLLSRAAG